MPIATSFMMVTTISVSSSTVSLCMRLPKAPLSGHTITYKAVSDSGPVGAGVVERSVPGRSVSECSLCVDGLRAIANEASVVGCHGRLAQAKQLEFLHQWCIEHDYGCKTGADRNSCKEQNQMRYMQKSTGVMGAGRG